MGVRRFPGWVIVLVAAALGLAGCEPYMSMTDQIPEHTRQATALLPESPRYVGMVDLETVMTQIDEVTDVHFADSLRETDNPRLRTFLDATGMDPETDLKAIYGAVGTGKSFSAVLFADLTPGQMDRYLDQATETAGRVTTYRDIPVYHLSAHSQSVDGDAVSDTLSLAFLRTGVIAVAAQADDLRAMVDRHRASAPGFRDNEPYMTLVGRVGHGSTAWLVGRDVLQTALRDSATGEDSVASARAAGLNGAGIQRVLSQWSDRVLGLSEATGSFDANTGGKIGRLRGQIREQAVSVTLTDDAVDAEVYLTMKDEPSATNVVDIARGALAAMRLSGGEDMNEGFREVVDGINIERNGPIVHVQFSISRERVRQSMETAHLRSPARPVDSSIRRSKGAIRRLEGITPIPPAFSLFEVLERRCNSHADRRVYCLARGTDRSVTEERG